ncbi:MAG TPA: transcription antitermination factor NusB [Terracidiphilus sp.]|nr:transcription antitermination factor NusB [Terracidiphilus sp.]
MPAVSPARAAAFDILKAVERGPAHSDDLLRAAKIARLSAADRNLTTALVLGTLRWQLVLDARIRPLLARPNAKLDTDIRLALRLGALQLFSLDRIPARAVIDESVELAKRAGHRFASGMVNAVLRKLAAHPAPLTENDAVNAYPAWMVERWQRHYGEAATLTLCAYGQRQARPTLRLASEAAERELAGEGIVLAPAALLTAARPVVSGDLTAIAARSEARTRLQDEGSQFVAEIAGHGVAILDCCAAPGGKTLILAERNPQAQLVAVDSSEPRIVQLRQRLAPLGSRIVCRLADAAALTDEPLYDLVLVDAPCSGTGTLGRNPEIRHRLDPAEFARQAERQQAILAAAIRAARPGGRIVYSTCSMEPEENEEVVAATLAASPGLRLVPPAQRLEAMRHEDILTAHGTDQLRACITAEGYLRLLPGALGTDGFFIAMLEKSAG